MTEQKLLFTKPIKNAVDSLYNRVLGGRGAILLIDGGQSSGKTTLAEEIGTYINNGKPFDWDIQYAMGGVDFIRKFYLASKAGYKYIVYDEAGDFTTKGVISTFNKELNHIFDKARAFGMLIVMCCPNFSVLDNGIFDQKLVRVLFNIEYKTNKYGKVRIYPYRGLMWIKHLMKTKYKIIPALAYNSITPFSSGVFRDSTDKKAISSKSMKGKKDLLIKNITKINQLYSIVDLTRELGRTDRWVRQKIKKLKLKKNEIEKFGRAYYYPKFVLKLLEKQINRGNK